MYVIDNFIYSMHIPKISFAKEQYVWWLMLQMFAKFGNDFPTNIHVLTQTLEIYFLGCKNTSCLRMNRVVYQFYVPSVVN